MKKKELISRLERLLSDCKVVPQSCADSSYPFMYGYLSQGIADLVMELKK